LLGILDKWRSGRPSLAKEYVSRPAKKISFWIRESWIKIGRVNIKVERKERPETQSRRRSDGRSPMV